jgi:hypothetical protein
MEELNMNKIKKTISLTKVVSDKLKELSLLTGYNQSELIEMGVKKLDLDKNNQTKKNYLEKEEKEMILRLLKKII